MRWLLTSQSIPVAPGGVGPSPEITRRGEGDRGIHPSPAEIPPGLAAQIPEGPSRARGDPAVPSPKSPGLEHGSGDIWSETRWRQSPDLRLQGISWGSRRAAPFPCAAPRGSKSQKSSWWKGKGTAGPCGFTPGLASGQQSRGKASRAPLPADQLPDPRKSIQTQGTAPQTAAAHGSWHCQG